MTPATRPADTASTSENEASQPSFAATDRRAGSSANCLVKGSWTGSLVSAKPFQLGWMVAPVARSSEASQLGVSTTKRTKGSDPSCASNPCTTCLGMVTMSPTLTGRASPAKRKTPAPRAT